MISAPPRRNAYSCSGGLQHVKATQVATEFGEDYQALRRILQEHYQLFRKEVRCNSCERWRLFAA